MAKLNYQTGSQVEITATTLPDGTIALSPVGGTSYGIGTIILSSKSGAHTIVLRRTSFESEKKYLKAARNYLKEKGYHIVNGIFSEELIQVLGIQKKINKILVISQEQSL